MSQGACGGVFSGLSSSAVHGGIHIERHVIDAAGGLCQMLHILGIVIGHEFLVGVFVGAEDVSPCPSLVDLEKFQEVGRHGLSVGFLCQWRMVAGTFQHPDLILYLHHDDGASALVLVSQMLHQGSKGF